MRKKIIFFLGLFAFTSCAQPENYKAPPSIQSFETSSETIQSGETVTLSWKTFAAEEVSLSIYPEGQTQAESIENVSNKKDVSIVLTQTTRFELTASNEAAEDKKWITVTVTPVVPQNTGSGTNPGQGQNPSTRPPMSVTFQASEGCIEKGHSTTLQWNVTDADFVGLSLFPPTVTSLPLQGVQIISPESTTSYTLTALQVYAPGLAHRTLKNVTVWVDEKTVEIQSSSLLQNISPPPGVEVTAMAINPDNALQIFLATTGRVYPSGDGGQSWGGAIPITGLTHAGASGSSRNLEIHDLLFSQGKLYIAASRENAKRVFRYDISQNRLDPLQPLNGKEILYLSEDHHHQLYAATTSQIFASSDEGQSWNEITSPQLANQNIQSMTVVNDALFVSTSQKLWRAEIHSLNAWQDFTNGLPSGTLETLKVGRVSGGIFAVISGASSREFYFRGSRESRWQLIEAPLLSPALPLGTLHLFSQHEKIYYRGNTFLGRFDDVRVHWPCSLDRQNQGNFRDQLREEIPGVEDPRAF